MASIDEQIKANNAQILKNNDEIARLTSEIATLTSVANDINVSGKGQNKSEQKAAQLRKDGIMANVSADKTKIPVLQSLNDQLANDNKALIKQRDAESQAMVNLSTQGKTTASVEKEATANADATRKIAESQAKALEISATEKASTDGKTKMIVIIAIVVVCLVISAIIIKKKLKKSK